MAENLLESSNESVFPSYESSVETDSDSFRDANRESDETRPAKKQRGKGKNYIHAGKFKSKKEAEVALKENGERQWSYYKKYFTADGTKFFYKCKLSSKCPVMAYILESGSVVDLYASVEEHCHEVLNDKASQRLSLELKNEINKLLENRIHKPKVILNTLMSKGISVPSSAQLSNYLAHYKKKKFENFGISLGELKEWCSKRNSSNDDPDSVIVPEYKIDYGDEQNSCTMRIFFTTKRLLENAIDVKHLAVDSTHQLNWNGYPVLMVGTTDVSKSYLPFGLFLAMNETHEDYAFAFQSLSNAVKRLFNKDVKPCVLLADASDAITNGFETVFGKPEKRIMCYADVIRNVEKNLNSSIPDKVREDLRSGISGLQLSTSKEMFDKESSEFVHKFKAHKNPSVDTFLNYFESEWIRKNNGWYKGYAEGYPSTNNALETTYRQIKKIATFRNRASVSEFLDIVENRILRIWSLERKPNLEIIDKKVQLGQKRKRGRPQGTKRALFIQ